MKTKRGKRSEVHCNVLFALALLSFCELRQYKILDYIFGRLHLLAAFLAFHGDEEMVKYTA